MFRWARMFVVVAAAGALFLVSVASAAGETKSVPYERCRHQHVHVRGTGGGSLKVTNLRVTQISCSHAAAALRAGSYEATPGGPLFSVPGFKCNGPVGPPPPGSKPRYYHCSHGSQRFEFLVPGFS